MDKAISRKIVKKRRFLMFLKITLSIILFFSVIFLFKMILTQKIDRSKIYTDVAIVGDIDASINASGVVIPEFEQIISSPISSKIDTVFKRAGENIVLGERILSLNTEIIRNSYEQKLDEYELQKNRKKQLALDLDRNIISLSTQLDIKELKIEFLNSKLVQEKRLSKIGAGTSGDLKQASLNLEIANLELNQLISQIANRKKSLEADLNELRLKIRITEKVINEISRKIENSKTISEKSGVITWVNDNIGKVVNQGEVIAKIADLNSFKVNCQISEIHVSKLFIGNYVKVRVNNKDLTGKIININPAIKNGVINFIVALDENNYKDLRSNMKVEVFVLTSSKKNIVRVKNGAFINGTGYNKVFVIKGDKAVRRDIRAGLTNFDYVEIIEGINDRA